MPVFMDDPSVLTKERLKSELLAHNVELPGGNPPRDVYVQLYVKTLSAQSHGTYAALDAFSSDEELPPPVVSRGSRSSGRKSEAAQLNVTRLDVTLLTDEALRDQLLVHGVHAGPIVASTRKLYEKKLQKLQDKGAILSEPQKIHNNSREAELYSDKEEELTADTGPSPAPEPESVPEQKKDVRSRRNNISQRLSSSQHSTMEKVQKVEQVEKIQTDPPLEEDPAVPELSLTGLTASCRRPIKGAAGRPVILASHSQSAHTEIKVSSSAFSSVGTTSSITNTTNPTLSSTHTAPSYTSLIPSRAALSLPDISAPSAHQVKAQRGTSWWKKLLLWAVLAGFLFLVYQAMETNSAALFEEAKEM